MLTLLLAAVLLPAPQATGQYRVSVPALRFQKNLRLPVKPKPVMAAMPQKAQARPGAVVEVLGDARPLESVREQTLREFREWLVASRFHGAAFAASFAPPLMSTASWEQTHPGGFTVAPLAPLGWSR
jgi:hypothetical protein